MITTIQEIQLYPSLKHAQLAIDTTIRVVITLKMKMTIVVPDIIYISKIIPMTEKISTNQAIIQSSIIYYHFIFFIFLYYIFLSI